MVTFQIKIFYNENSQESQFQETQNTRNYPTPQNNQNDLQNPIQIESQKRKTINRVFNIRTIFQQKSSEDLKLKSNEIIYPPKDIGISNNILFESQNNFQTDNLKLERENSNNSHPIFSNLIANHQSNRKLKIHKQNQVLSLHTAIFEKDRIKTILFREENLRERILTAFQRASTVLVNYQYDDLKIKTEKILKPKIDEIQTIKIQNQEVENKRCESVLNSYDLFPYSKIIFQNWQNQNIKKPFVFKKRFYLEIKDNVAFQFEEITFNGKCLLEKTKRDEPHN